MADERQGNPSVGTVHRQGAFGVWRSTPNEQFLGIAECETEIFEMMDTPRHKMITAQERLLDA